MDRVFKFRVWDKTTNNWHEAETLTIHYKGFLLDVPPDLILMQFTGLKDSTGCEVYEDDILRTESAGFGVVVWSDHGYWAIKLLSIPGDPRILHSFAVYGGKVIGNIHENPDLLKQP